MKSLFLTFGMWMALSLGPRTGDPASAQPRLQGTWQSVAAERNGAPAPDLVGHRIVFTRDRFEITRRGELLYGGTYVSESKTATSEIDFHQDAGPELRGEWKGIYRLHGSRLEIVDNADDKSKPRPTHFSTAPGSGYVLVRFELR